MPGARVLGVPLATALNPYRAVLAIIDPAQGTAPIFSQASLSFMAIALALAFALLTFGVLMLRVWNPGSNEPREERGGEGEREIVETLVEVDQAAEPTLVGAGVGVGAASAADAREGFAADRPGPAPLQRRGRPGAESPGPGATTGLHVPRRTHRRIAPA